MHLMEMLCMTGAISMVFDSFNELQDLIESLERPSQEAPTMKRNLWLAVALLGVLPFAAQSAPAKGDREFQLSGIGTRDYDSNKTTFGASGSIGWFLTDHHKVGVRQRIRLDQSKNADNLWHGETLGFYDFHFQLKPLQPFVGAGLGYVYGERFNDTFIAAPEVGVNFYLQAKTFITLQLEYQFLLRRR
jgi:hypothetical protein